MKIVALVGSLRKESFNMQLAKTIQDRYKDKLDLDISDIGILPHFNQDSELEPPQSVKDYKQQIKEADGVIVITPEYNWSVPGVLKNALDWLSRVDTVLVGKPVMIAGVSPGIMGTIRAQLQLRQILASPGLQANVLQAAGNEFLINGAPKKFDQASGLLVDDSTLNFLDTVIDNYIEHVKSTK